MSRDVVKELNRKLEETGPGVSLAVETCFDCYFDVVRGLVDVFGPKNDLETIYVTASIPASTMLNALEALDADTGRLYFVDCLSHMIMGNIEPNDRIIFLENPTMLEYIILKVEYLIRRFENRSCLVILDSIDSLAIHNDLKILSEFMQICLGGLKSREVYPVVLCMREQTSREIIEMVKLVCDDYLSFSEQREESV